MPRTATAISVALCLLSAGTVGAGPPRTQPEQILDNQGVRPMHLPRATEMLHDLQRPPRGATSDANWVSLGPFGGDVAATAESPTNPLLVLAGVVGTSYGGGLYRSIDGAAHWSQVATLPPIAVNAVRFSPDGTAYIGTDSGVWKSTDEGVSWNHLNLNIGFSEQVLALTIDPSNPLKLWAGVSDAIDSQPINVVRSVDGGATWSNATPPHSAPMSCTGISVNPLNSDAIYACFGGAFGGGEVWFSGDGGISWSNRSAGLPNNPLFDVLSIGNRLYVCGGQAFGLQYVGLYQSVNDGLVWSPVHDASWPSLALNDIEIAPGNPLVILVASDSRGLFRSADGGASWSFGVGGTDGASLRSVRFAPGSAGRIYLGANSAGVLKSEDAGASFMGSSIGINSLDTYSISANPLDPDELAVAFQSLNSGGVYTSTDGGASWSLEPLPPTRYNAVRFSPNGV